MNGHPYEPHRFRMESSLDGMTRISRTRPRSPPIDTVTRSSRHSRVPPSASETYNGFIKDLIDAQCVVEAVVAGHLHAVNNFPVLMSGVRIRNGTVLVIAERANKPEKSRWRDGLNWSYSRISGPFLLYREVEPVSQARSTNDTSSEPAEFTLRSVRPNTQLVPNGLAKRTLSITGSDGTKFRVVNYFYVHSVEHHYGVFSNDRNIVRLATPSTDSNLYPFHHRPCRSQSEPKRKHSGDATPPLVNLDHATPHLSYRRVSSENALELAAPSYKFRKISADSMTSMPPTSHILSPIATIPSGITYPDHDFLYNRFQVEVLNFGGSSIRRRSTDYFNGHPFWSDTPLLNPITSRPFANDSHN